MILVHHLRVGRSLFTVWLLEELGLDYELKIYLRHPETNRAGPELREPHPLGKSPVIEDGDLKLAESGAIASYLIDTYDPDHLLAPPPGDRAARALWLQWLHYSEGSAFLPFMMKLLLAREAEPKSAVFSAFAGGEVPLHLDYIAGQLGDKDYLLGDRLQAPDIGLGFILFLAHRLGELNGHPTLQAYLQRLTSRPAFLRAKERAGE